jgi:hypothetical protein
MLEEKNDEINKTIKKKVSHSRKTDFTHRELKSK